MLEQQLAGFKDSGTFKVERVITSAQGPSVDVEASAQPVLNFWCALGGGACVWRHVRLCARLRQPATRVLAGGGKDPARASIIPGGQR